MALVSLAGPAGADTPAPSVTTTQTPASTPQCVLDAAAIKKSKVTVVEVTVRHADSDTAPDSVTLPVRIDSVLKGAAKVGDATLVVDGHSCGGRNAAGAKPKDILLVIGTVDGAHISAQEIGPSVIAGDQACALEKALGKEGSKICTQASTGVKMTALNPDKVQPWLKIAAPGLAAIIVAVLGLLLVRLRRR